MAVALLAVVFVQRINPLPQGALALTLALAAFGFVAEWQAMELPAGGSASVAFALNTAAVQVLGSAGGVFVAVASSVPPQDFVNRRPVMRVGFNVAQLALSAAVAGVFSDLASALLVSAGLERSLVASMLIGVVVVFALYVSNSTLVAVAISLDQGIGVATILRENAREHGPSFAITGLIGICLGLAIQGLGVSALFFAALPLAATKATFAVQRVAFESYEQMLGCLVGAIEARDSYTKGHSERVAGLCRAIGVKMGLSASRLSRLHRAALLHDVGKIGIDGAVLTKPGALSASEYDTVKRHPSLGVEILGGIESLRDVLTPISMHHERLDGCGYPEGASQLPLEARIIAVADTFDALTSARPYRDARPIGDAMEEIWRCSGSQLDPDVAKAMQGIASSSHELALAGVGLA